MQKTPLSQIIREEITRALIFAGVFFVIMVSGFSLTTYAAEGWLFWELLNKILVKSWNDPTNDGTVKNAEKLNNTPASGFIKVPTNKECGSLQCVYGIDATGEFLCR